MARAKDLSRPPPPRYRIIERDGRLVTIDTWAKGASPPSPALPTRTRGTAPGTWRARRAAPAGSSLIAILLSVKDAQGRRLLTTGPNWDRKGPRTIALSPFGEQRLGRILLAAIVTLMIAVLLMIVEFDLVFPIAVVLALLLGSTGAAGGAFITRFLDSLGETLPR